MKSGAAQCSGAAYCDYNSAQRERDGTETFFCSAPGAPGDYCDAAKPRPDGSVDIVSGKCDHTSVCKVIGTDANGSDVHGCVAAGSAA
jgi:hypothetical protein